MAGGTLLAVDVGSGAARAGLFDADGRLLAVAAQDFPLLRPQDAHAVYRMDAIWSAVGGAVRTCVGSVPDAAGAIAGMAFGATAALVLAHDGAAPLEGGADVFAATDHRAVAEAEEISATGDIWLELMGGRLSPENHLPKLLWLKRRAPQAWERITAVRDLVDELGFRATGVDAHSHGALVSKWPYLPQDIETGGWRHGLLERLELDGVWTLGALSDPPRPPGSVHGGLSATAAITLGLPAGIPVATGLIDAHAGLLGVFGRAAQGHLPRVLALVGGRSSSLLAMAPDARRVPGVWGPFQGAILPGGWLDQGGQSCTGAALDAVLADHPGGPRIATAEIHGSVAGDIIELLDREGPGFAAGRHIVPDWLGNRVPTGDGGLRALVTGMGEETGYRSFLEVYYATARALALQARQIVAQMNRHGQAIDRVALSGGQARNPLMVRLYRDALGVGLVRTEAAEPVLLGIAMPAAVAAGLHPDLLVALDMMSAPQLRHTADPAWRTAHEAAYRIYLKLYEVRNVVARESKALERLTAR